MWDSLLVPQKHYVVISSGLPGFGWLVVLRCCTENTPTAVILAFCCTSPEPDSQVLCSEKSFPQTDFPSTLPLLRFSSQTWLPVENSTSKSDVSKDPGSWTVGFLHTFRCMFPSQVNIKAFLSTLSLGHKERHLRLYSNASNRHTNLTTETNVLHTVSNCLGLFSIYK